MSALYFVASHSIGAPEHDDAFWDAFDQLRAVLRRMDYDLEGPETESSAVQDISAWFLDRHDTAIRVFDSKVTKVRHLELSASDEVEVQAIASAMRAVLPLHDHEALLHAWAGAAIDEPNIVVKLALSAPDPLPVDTFGVIVDALSDPSPAVRCHAAYAMALHGDPSFEAPLEERLPQEEDVNARDIIGRALQMYAPG